MLTMLPAAIRYELGDKHSFDFVEGSMPYDIDPSKSKHRRDDVKRSDTIAFQT